MEEYMAIPAIEGLVPTDSFQICDGRWMMGHNIPHNSGAAASGASSGGIFVT
jgi:hypothetical protein